MPQQAPAIGTVQAGYMFMGGDPAQQASWRAVAPSGTHASGRPRGLSANEQKELAAAREAARDALSILPDLERFSRLNTEQDSGGIYALPLVDRIAGARDPEASQMNEITARMAPAQREPGSGTTSDTDLRLFLQASPSIQRPREANQALIERGRAEGRRRQAYADFIDRYAAERGTLSGADELFRAQVAAGQIDLAGYGAARREDNQTQVGGAATPGPAAPGAPPSGASPTPGSSPDAPLDFTSSSRDEVIAAIQRGGWFRQGPDGQPYQLPPGDPQFGAKDGDQMVAPGVGVRPRTQAEIEAEAMASRTAQGEGVGRKLDAGVRGIADTLTFGFADEIAAGANSVLPLDRGSESMWTRPIGDAFRHNLAMQRGIDRADARDVPVSRGTGQVAGAVVPGAQLAGVTRLAARPIVRNSLLGAGYGAVYGAGSDQGTAVERLDGAAVGGGFGAIGGAVAAPAANAFAAVARGVARPAVNILGENAPAAVRDFVRRPPATRHQNNVRTLQDNGVSLTPGQRMGGLAQSVENLAQRAPILGPAIRGARERGVESFNRAVGNRALDAIGEGVPSGVNAGGDMVGHVQSRLGAQFDRAYSMLPEFTTDAPLMEGIERIARSKADLPPAMQQQFDNIITERLGRLDDAATGQNVGAVRSELNTLAAGYLRAPDPAQQGLGRMIAEVADELDGAVARASPEAGEILSRAREGYSDFIRLERASTAAGGRPFGPGQLESAVRASDGSVRRGAVGRGEARMQDLSSAARSVMPDSFGNPGTADAVGLGGVGVGLMTEPVTTAGVVAGLGVASLPYRAMNRQVVERLPAGSRRLLQGLPDDSLDSLMSAAADPARQAEAAEMLAAQGLRPREARNMARAIRHQVARITTDLQSNPQRQ